MFLVFRWCRAYLAPTPHANEVHEHAWSASGGCRLARRQPYEQVRKTRSDRVRLGLRQWNATGSMCNFVALTYW